MSGIIWGVFDLRNTATLRLDAVHVVEATEDGIVKPPHVLHRNCTCRPNCINEPGCAPVFVHLTEH